MLIVVERNFLRTSSIWRGAEFPCQVLMSVTVRVRILTLSDEATTLFDEATTIFDEATIF